MATQARPVSCPRVACFEGLLPPPLDDAVPPVVELRARPRLAGPMARVTVGLPALVAQRIEHLTTDQKVGGSNPSERAAKVLVSGLELPSRFAPVASLRPDLLPDRLT
jgi:hypothetical protein